MTTVVRGVKKCSNSPENDSSTYDALETQNWWFWDQTLTMSWNHVDRADIAFTLITSAGEITFSIAPL